MMNKSSVEKIIHKTGESPFSIHMTKVSPDETNALYLHYHSEAEFFYLDQGDILFHIENQSFHLTSGDGIFIPPGCLHNAVRKNPENHPCIYHAVVFQTAPMEALFSQNAPYFQPLRHNPSDCIILLSFREEKNSRILATLQTIFSYVNCPPDTCELAVIGALFICWQELYQFHFKALLSSHTPSGFSDELQRVQVYIREHFGETITLTDLAREAGFSESHLCHRFKAVTGYTPFGYVNRVRMAKGCELLSKTNKKITDVASLCGFNNISYFNRMFTKTMGVSPSAYRKQF